MTNYERPLFVFLGLVGVVLTILMAALLVKFLTSDNGRPAKTDPAGVVMMVCDRPASVRPHPPVAQPRNGIMLGVQGNRLVVCDLTGEGDCRPAGAGDGNTDEACRGYWDGRTP